MYVTCTEVHGSQTRGFLNVRHARVACFRSRRYLRFGYVAAWPEIHHSIHQFALRLYNGLMFGVCLPVGECDRERAII